MREVNTVNKVLMFLQGCFYQMEALKLTTRNIRVFCRWYLKAPVASVFISCFS